MSPQMGEYTLEDDIARMAAHAANFGLHALVIRKAADGAPVNNSVVLVNDPELLFPIAANEVWSFMIYLLHNTGAVPDIKVGLAVPAGGTWWLQQQNSNDVAADGVLTCIGRTADALNVFFAVVRNGVLDGNVVVQWAQDVANVSDTYVRHDSCIIAHRIA